MFDGLIYALVTAGTFGWLALIIPDLLCNSKPKSIAV